MDAGSCMSRSSFTRLPAALEREWLVTNGLGGFASDAIALANTRHCHAPVGRRAAPIAVVALLRKASRELPVASSCVPSRVHRLRVTGT